MANKTINELTAVSSITNADEVEVQKSGEAGTKKATVAQLTAVEAAARAAQDDVIEASVGLSTAGAYVVLANSWYLRAAEFTAGMTDRGGASGALTASIMNAIRLLDAKLYNTITGLGIVKTASVSVSTGDVLGCNASPKELLPAISGYVYEIISVICDYDYNTAPFEAGTDKLEIRYASGDTMFEFPNAMLESVADCIYRGLVTTEAIMKEGKVELYCASAPTGGGGSMVFHITYREHAV